MARDAWLDSLRGELDAARGPVTFSFRDDDGGWEDERLLALLDVFADYSLPLDVAVIPASLSPGLAADLRTRSEGARGLLGFHQHGYAHENHEPSGRPCEFGPSRPAQAQRRDIEAGARRLRELIGETAPIFTPPWNRCTPATGRCLLELGFRALARDSSAEPLGIDGLRELCVHVDWFAHRKGRRVARAELGDRLAAAARANASAAIMLHHALVYGHERDALERLLTLLTSHRNARCERLTSFLAD